MWGGSATLPVEATRQIDTFAEAKSEVYRETSNTTETIDFAKGGRMKKETKQEVTLARHQARFNKKQWFSAASVVFTLAAFFTGGSTGSTPTNQIASWCGGYSIFKSLNLFSKDSASNTLDESASILKKSQNI